MNGLQIRVAALSDVGLVRKINEDAYSVTDLDTGRRLEPEIGPGEFPAGARGVLLALSDGMGGHAAGEVASAMVIDSLRRALESGDPGEPIDGRIAAAVKEANTDVAEASRAEGRSGMGATLTAVLLRSGEAHVAEVGDSRAYMLRAGTLHQLTRDQSLVQFLVDQGALTPEAARVSSRKNVLLQAVGIADDVRTSIGRLALRRGDRFLLCSDGVSNPVHDDELKRLLEESDPALTCRMLIDMANDRGGTDNMTVIVAHVDGDALEPAETAEPLHETFEVLQTFSGVPRPQV